MHAYHPNMHPIPEMHFTFLFQVSGQKKPSRGLGLGFLRPLPSTTPGRIEAATSAKRIRISLETPCSQKPILEDGITWHSWPKHGGGAAVELTIWRHVPSDPIYQSIIIYRSIHPCIRSTYNFVHVCFGTIATHVKYVLWLSHP